MIKAVGTAGYCESKETAGVLSRGTPEYTICVRSKKHRAVPCTGGSGLTSAAEALRSPYKVHTVIIDHSL